MNETRAVLLSPDQERLLGLLRTKGLSVKCLGQADRDGMRALLVELHLTRGMSLTDIAKLVGNKTSGYTSWLCRQLGVKARPFEEARLRGIKEKRRKYERKPFDGTDEDRSYLLGLRHGDLSVSQPWKGVVRVSTSTTHPAMVELFRRLFEPYGHVYQHPRYKKEMNSYEWNLSAILDSSFDFLLLSFAEIRDWVSTTAGLPLCYLSGLLDAEGSIITTRDNRGNATLFVDYYNSNKTLLEWVKRQVESLGCHCSIRINKRKGTLTKKYGIVHRSDYWQLSAYGVDTIMDLVDRLHPRHREKIVRREVAMTVRKGEPFSLYEEKVQTIRASIKSEVEASVEKAKHEYEMKHTSG